VNLLRRQDWDRFATASLLIFCIATLGCASEALSLEDPTVRTVQINPNVLSVQREGYTLEFTANFSQGERDSITLTGLSAPDLESIGLRVEKFAIHSDFEFSIEVSILPNPQTSIDPQLVQIFVETSDGYTYTLEGSITLLAL